MKFRSEYLLSSLSLEIDILLFLLQSYYFLFAMILFYLIIYLFIHSLIN